tara:strand:+ start:703 stop:873 length:171 start_codon:yes stop_codon:yes gene_type:complete
MVKFYKVEKDGKEIYKTTSLSMAIDYKKSNGGVVKNKCWTYDDDGFPHRTKGTEGK